MNLKLLYVMTWTYVIKFICYVNSLFFHNYPLQLCLTIVFSRHDFID